MSVVETEEQTETIIEIFNRLAEIGRRERQRQLTKEDGKIRAPRPKVSDHALSKEQISSIT